MFVHGSLFRDFLQSIMGKFITIFFGFCAEKSVLWINITWIIWCLTLTCMYLKYFHLITMPNVSYWYCCHVEILKCLLHSRHLSQEDVTSTNSLIFLGKGERLGALRFYGFWHHLQSRSAEKSLCYSYFLPFRIWHLCLHCIGLQVPCFILWMASIRRMSLDQYPGFDTVRHW